MTANTTPSGLIVEDLTIGQGAEAVGRGQFVTVHYTGWLQDGTEFDSSRRRNEPFGFPLGTGYVIPGWDQGVVGARVETAPNWSDHVVVDGNLVTGQNPQSSASAARAVIGVLSGATRG